MCNGTPGIFFIFLFFGLTKAFYISISKGFSVAFLIPSFELRSHYDIHDDLNLRPLEYAAFFLKQHNSAFVHKKKTIKFQYIYSNTSISSNHIVTQF